MRMVKTTEDFQQIAGRPLSTVEELFTLLSKFHSTLYDAFGYSSVRSADALKKTHNKTAIKWARPQFIRFYVHDFLGQKGIKAQLVDENDEAEEEEVIFEPRVLPSNGIAGNIRGFEYRLLKIFRGGLPPPVTDRRKSLYRQDHLKAYQPMLPNLLGDKLDMVIVKPNLFYLWEIVRNRPIIYLAIPNSDVSYASTRLTLIPNPITTMKQTGLEEGLVDAGKTQQFIEVGRQK